MAARKSSRVNRKYKTKYRVTNWQEYERGLRSRGDITVWFSDEAREAWTPQHDPRDDSQCRAPRLAAGVRVSTTGRRPESFLQVQAHARKQPSCAATNRRSGRR